MKSILACLCCGAALFFTGCAQDSAPIGNEDAGQVENLKMPPASSARITKPSPWDIKSIGGGVFRDETEFRKYVRRAEFVGRGTLMMWNGRNGLVAIDEIYHGQVPYKEMNFTATGGFVLPKAGDEVLVLLSTQGGSLKLHSFCGASGLYTFTDYLDAHLKTALQPQNI